MGAAIYVENFSAHLSRRRKIEDSFDDVLYVNDLSGWRSGGRARFVVLVQGRGHDARSHGVEANTLACIFDCQAPCNRIQAALRHHRNRCMYASDRLISERSCDAYHAPRPLLQHLFHSKLSHVDEPRQVG